MPTEGERKILAEIKKGLKPPTKQEIDEATARWLFGARAEKMLRYAPWSLILMKLMWKNGEEPWGS